MRPILNKIILQPLDKKITSLIIPPKYAYRAKEFSSGKVLALGKNVTEVKVGDEVAYTKDFGVTVDMDGKQIVVIKQDLILAVV